jgi:hypothetical protein
MELRVAAPALLSFESELPIAICWCTQAGRRRISFSSRENGRRQRERSAVFLAAENVAVVRYAPEIPTTQSDLVESAENAAIMRAFLYYVFCLP